MTTPERTPQPDLDAIPANPEPSADAGSVRVPRSFLEGMIPTLNNTGFMFETLDDYAEAFIRLAGGTDAEVADIGCAYGAATIPALKAGARVLAVDPDPRHLDILSGKVPDELGANLHCLPGALPDIDLPADHFAAILCSRVLHFLHGDTVDRAVAGMYRWLAPGGKLFLVADTPYGIWRKFIPTWEANKARDERWPGMMTGLGSYLPRQMEKVRGPDFMNLLDHELLARSCEEAGFTIERASFIARPDFGGLGSMDGRENAGVIGVKPA